MSVIDAIALFIIMLALAAIPSASVVLVITRSATMGVANGIAVSLGIVCGDLIFITLVMFGLSVVAQTMGGIFLTIKILGGVYLIWLGLRLLVTKNKETVMPHKINGRATLVSSFIAGLFLTLGDIKAIFFYASLLPVFVNLSVLSRLDFITIIFLTISTVGGVKVFYAFSAQKAMKISQGSGFEKAARKVAGSFMVGAGSYLIIKS